MFSWSKRNFSGPWHCIQHLTTTRQLAHKTSCDLIYLAITEWGWVLRIWRILQIKEGVIHRGRRRVIFPCSWRSFAISLFVLPLSKITQHCPQVFSVNGSIICSGLHFWRHFDVIGPIIFGGLHFWRHWFNMPKILSKFGEQQLVMVNYACDFNQSKTGKYFKWIIIYFNVQLEYYLTTRKQLESKSYS